MNLLLAPLGAFVIIFLSARNWRLTVKAVLVVAVLEGVLRKWVLPQVSDQVYLLKDVMLAGAYFAYWNEPKDREDSFRVLSAVKFLLLLATLWCVAQAFNPRLGSVLVGFFGVKAYLYDIPLIWLVSNLFLTEDELFRFLRNYLLLVIPVTLLAIVQFFSPASSPLNIYAGGMESNAAFANFGNIRVTGTFSYLTGYSVYLIFCFSLVIPILQEQKTWLWRAISIGELLLIIVTSFMSGARSLVLFEVLFLVGYVILLGIKHLQRAAQYVGFLFIIAALAFVLINNTSLKRGFDAFVYRATTSDNLSGRILGDLGTTSEYLRKAQFIGYGTGATHQAAAPLRKMLGLPPAPEELITSEGELGRVAIELGPVGLYLWYGLRLTLILCFAYLFLRVKQSSLASLALAVFLLHAIEITGPLVFNHTFAVFFWFATGFLPLFLKISKTQNLKNALSKSPQQSLDITLGSLKRSFSA